MNLERTEEWGGGAIQVCMHAHIDEASGLVLVRLYLLTMQLKKRAYVEMEMET